MHLHTQKGLKVDELGSRGLVYIPSLSKGKIGMPKKFIVLTALLSIVMSPAWATKVPTILHDEATDGDLAGLFISALVGLVGFSRSKAKG